ncbi:MAG: fatty acid desaturase [Puniceicoccaceae bacterium]|nr:MAG: fatty acid desaturase [Puniceicoccaceae bacterium]
MRIKNWDTLLFIGGYHILVLALLPWVVAHASWTAAAFFVLTWVIGGLCVTAGYHRLYAHRAYSANPVFEWMVLLGSTLAFQWSALIWSHDHRLHHKHVDTNDDPYSIKKGFWYAHVLWLFDYQRTFQKALVPDLLRNPRVVFQDRHYLLLAIGVNLAVFGLGCLVMHPLASLYFGFLLRVMAIHHCTWFINSLAHTWGSKTFARELTAVDNAVLAVLTFGEGYHNYHHAFASDYRNGIRWYHFDPTKWLIWLCARLGIVGNLKIVDRIRLQKALVVKDKELIMDRLSREFDELASDMRQRLEELSTSFEANSTLLMKRLRELKTASDEKRRLLKVEVRRLKGELRANWKAWLELTRLAARRYELAH